MLLRLEVHLAGAAMGMVHHIGALVRADRHFVEGNIRDRGERGLKLGIDRPLLLLACLNAALEGRHLVHQFLREGIVLFRLRLTDLLRRVVAGLLHFLQRGDDFPPPLVDLDKARGLRREPALREPCIETLSVVANGLDVEHDNLKVMRFPECRSTKYGRIGRRTYPARLSRPVYAEGPKASRRGPGDVTPHPPPFRLRLSSFPSRRR